MAFNSNNWTALPSRTLVTAASGGGIQGRVLWRRPTGGNFQFQAQLRVNDSIFSSHARVRWNIHGWNNGATGQAIPSRFDINRPWGTGWSAWTNIGHQQSRTLAQVGNANFNVQCDIQFQTGSFMFGGTQIGNGVWRDIQSTTQVQFMAPGLRWNNTPLTWNGTNVTWSGMQ